MSSSKLSLNSQLTKQSVDTANSDEFICMNNPNEVLVDQGELSNVFLKIELSFKNELIDRLNFLSQSLFNKTLTDEQRINVWKENNAIISSLNDLPVLIDEEKVAKVVQEKTGEGSITSGGQESKNDEMNNLKHEVDSLKNEVTSLKNEENSESQIGKGFYDSKSIGASSLTNDLEEDPSKRFLNEIEFILSKISKFDPKTEDIAAWLLKYEMHTLSFDWDDSERFCGLIYFLDSGLLRIIKEKETFNFNELRSSLINAVEDLLSSKYDDLHSKIERIITKFNKYNFTAYERNFWLDCLAPADKIKEYYESLEDCEENREKFDFYKDHLSHVLF